jgi:DNA-binding transcriptional ArsR family regulator
VAALVGDTARATMLAALMGGQSLTATELAYCANVSRSTASGHLSKLVAARLLTVTRKRRFSYYRIASPLVATMLESIKVVAAIEVPPRHQPRSAHDDALRFARSCYDHLAGRAGVAITDALVAMTTPASWYDFLSHCTYSATISRLIRAAGERARRSARNSTTNLRYWV